MPEGSPGTGFDIRRLFSPGPQAREGREDPRTEPHVPAHAAPENPTPITLEDMSDQGGVGSVSKAEATLTHPSARDTYPSSSSVLYRFFSLIVQYAAESGFMLECRTGPDSVFRLGLLAVWGCMY